jgi:hypothetical protein
VLKNYRNNGLWLDVMGILPFNILIQRYSDSGKWAVLRLVRLVSAWRSIRLFTNFEISFKNNQFSAFIHILKAIAYMFTLGHLVACAWFFLNT